MVSRTNYTRLITPSKIISYESIKPVDEHKNNLNLSRKYQVIKSTVHTEQMSLLKVSNIPHLKGLKTLAAAG